MLSTAIFPCLFTDGARVLGELSYALEAQVYTDRMLLQKIADGYGADVQKLETQMFGCSCKHGPSCNKRVALLPSVKYELNQLIAAPGDMIYYGFFTLLLESTESFIQKILIFADLDCRLERAGLQEGLNEIKARKVIREHDQKATWWSQFLFNSSPYNQDLYDTFIRYECQDLVDVVAYVYMVHEEHAQPDYQSCA